MVHSPLSLCRIGTPPLCTHGKKVFRFLYTFISFTHFHFSNRSDVVLVLFLMNIEISIAAIPKTR